MEILSSLHSEAISSLYLSWKEINKKSLDNLALLSDVMAPIHNFKNYRNAIKDLKPNQAYIPYLGIFLSDLVRLFQPLD